MPPHFPLPSHRNVRPRSLASVPTGLLIGGQWRDASDGGTFDVHDPATGEVLATLASATSEDALAALDAADAAQASWARTAPRERAEILRRAFDLVTERAEDFALLMTLEMGKPLAEARGEVTYGAEFLRWFSEETVRDYGRYLTTPEGKNKILVQHKPVGPCLLITPWNFPLAMATRKVAPAVAAGCTMVLKPAKLTPLTAQFFAQTMLDAGLPAGVLNVVASSSAVRDLRARCWPIRGCARSPSPAPPRWASGSWPTPRRTCCAPRWNSAATPRSSCSRTPTWTKPSKGAMAAKMRNMGEACTAANRFLVQESVAAGVHPEVRRRHGRPGHRPRHRPGHPGGPAHRRRRPRRRARPGQRRRRRRSDRRHRRRTRGRARATSTRPPCWPTCPNDAEILRQEIFGPVAPVTTFATEEDAIRLANATEYGLASYLYSRDFNRLLRVAEQIEFGMVGFNAGVISNAAAPFGGVKQSGLGREGGSEGIAEYTTTQYIGIADPYAS